MRTPKLTEYTTCCSFNIIRKLFVEVVVFADPLHIYTCCAAGGAGRL